METRKDNILKDDAMQTGNYDKTHKKTAIFKKLSVIRKEK